MHERPPDLTSLLYRFQRQASVEWYPLGLAFGVPEDCLEELKQYTEEQCLIEVLKYWLRNHYGRPTWQEVEKVQEKVETYMKKIVIQNEGKILLKKSENEREGKEAGEEG